jgi:DNA processing protein
MRMTQPNRQLSDAERLDWIRLIRTENVGPVTFHRLLGQYGSAKAALAALPELARRGGRVKPLTIPVKAVAEKELAAVRKGGGTLLCACEPDYPDALAAIDDAPPVLACRGHLSLLRRPCVAIVGARNASLNAKKFAENLARELSGPEHGFVVVSGLARGIDAAAHKGALGGGTIAVMAGGVDVVYPEENQALYQEIVGQGLVLAESPLGVQPQARHFPRRNRIVSGLSLGVLVVEAALRSGSLITARMGLEQGREVMAVPGSPLDPRCNGTNDLLRQGAGLVENAGDVARLLAGARKPVMKERQPGLFDQAPAGPPDEAEVDYARDLLLEALGPTPVSVDELARGCELSMQAVSSVLLELELAGRLERQPGNRVCLIG